MPFDSLPDNHDDRPAWIETHQAFRDAMNAALVEIEPALVALGVRAPRNLLHCAIAERANKGRLTRLGTYATYLGYGPGGCVTRRYSYATGRRAKLAIELARSAAA